MSSTEATDVVESTFVVRSKIDVKQTIAALSAAAAAANTPNCNAIGHTLGLAAAQTLKQVVKAKFLSVFIMGELVP